MDIECYFKLLYFIFQIVGLGDWIESHVVAEDVAVILLSGLLKLQSHLSSKKLTIFTEDIVHIIGRIGCKDLFSLDHSQLYLNPGRLFC